MAEKSDVVLGAYGGIGEALTRRLARRGARTLVAGRDAGRLEQLAGEVGGEACTVDADTARGGGGLSPPRGRGLRARRRRRQLRRRLSAQARSRHHGGGMDSMIATNLRSAFAVVRAAGTIMADHGGSIVLVSSAAARIGLANHEAIAAAKAGVEGLARAAAATYAPKGIRVNCVAPGLTLRRSPPDSGRTRRSPRRRPACTHWADRGAGGGRIGHRLATGH